MGKSDKDVDHGVGLVSGEINLIGYITFNNMACTWRKNKYNDTS